jgi:hypothetical protein
MARVQSPFLPADAAAPLTCIGNIFHTHPFFTACAADAERPDAAPHARAVPGREPQTRAGSGNWAGVMRCASPIGGPASNWPESCGEKPYGVGAGGSASG